MSLLALVATKKNPLFLFLLRTGSGAEVRSQSQGGPFQRHTPGCSGWEYERDCAENGEFGDFVFMVGTPFNQKPLKLLFGHVQKIGPQK